MCDRYGKQVKITDFNISKFCSNKEKFYNKNQKEIDVNMWTNTGTLSYKAPEILNEKAKYK